MSFNRNNYYGVTSFSGFNESACMHQTTDCPCFPPVEACACVPIPTAAQSGYVLTVVGNQYVPLPVSSAAADFAGQMRPADGGLLAWTYDPMFLEFAVTQNGFIYLSKIFIHEPTVVNSIAFAGVSNGVLTPGQSFVGVYSTAGALIVQAPMDPPANSMGFLASPIPSTQLAPGAYFIAFLFNVESGDVSGFARNGCGYQELFTGFNGRALLTTANNYTALPAQFTPADFEEIDCLNLWAGLA